MSLFREFLPPETWSKDADVDMQIAKMLVQAALAASEKGDVQRAIQLLQVAIKAMG